MVISGASRAARLVAALIVVAVAACGPSSSGSGEAPDAVVAAEVTYDYEDGNECQADGHPHHLLAADADAGIGWVDLDLDGTADVIRADDEVYFRPEPVEGFPTEAPWIQVSGDTSSDENVFAQSTALASVASGLLEGVVEPLVREGLEDRENPSHLEPDNPRSPLLAWSEDGDGEVQELTITPQQPTPTGYRSVTYERVAAPAPPEVPGGSEVVSFVDVPAAGAVLGSSLYDPACSELSAAVLDELRACVAGVLGDRTVGEWLAETDPAELQAALACP